LPSLPWLPSSPSKPDHSVPHEVADRASQFRCQSNSSHKLLCLSKTNLCAIFGTGTIARSVSVTLCLQHCRLSLCLCRRPVFRPLQLLTLFVSVSLCTIFPPKTDPDLRFHLCPTLPVLTMCLFWPIKTVSMITFAYSVPELELYILVFKFFVSYLSAVMQLTSILFCILLLVLGFLINGLLANNG
jgi:hypothetical protein